MGRPFPTAVCSSRDSGLGCPGLSQGQPYRSQTALAAARIIRRWSSVMYSGGGTVATVSGVYWAGNAGTDRGQILMAKAARLRILYGEGNAEAQAATAGAFEKAGHTVEKALGRKAVEAALSKGPFDLIVLGPTLSRNDRHHLPYAVKKVHAEVSVLVMHADGSRHPYVDACTDTGASIENVLARIESMKIAGMMPMAAGAAAGR